MLQRPGGNTAGRGPGRVLLVSGPRHGPGGRDQDPKSAALDVGSVLAGIGPPDRRHPGTAPERLLDHPAGGFFPDCPAHGRPGRGPVAPARSGDSGGGGRAGDHGRPGLAASVGAGPGRLVPASGRPADRGGAFPAGDRLADPGGPGRGIHADPGRGVRPGIPAYFPVAVFSGPVLVFHRAGRAGPFCRGRGHDRDRGRRERHPGSAGPDPDRVFF